MRGKKDIYTACRKFCRGQSLPCPAYGIHCTLPVKYNTQQFFNKVAKNAELKRGL